MIKFDVSGVTEMRFNPGGEGQLVLHGLKTADLPTGHDIEIRRRETGEILFRLEGVQNLADKDGNLMIGPVDDGSK